MPFCKAGYLDFKMQRSQRFIPQPHLAAGPESPNPDTSPNPEPNPNPILTPSLCPQLPTWLQRLQQLFMQVRPLQQGPKP